MDGLYQAHALRAAGFYIIVIDQIAPALQIFYLVVMYLSAFPIILSLRQSNIYEERSLGQDDDLSARGEDPRDSHGGDSVNTKPRSLLGEHIRQQLAYDI